MGFFDSMIDSLVPKARTAIREADVSRKARLKKVMLEVLGTELPDKDLDLILTATKQGDAVRGVAGVAGKNLMGDVLGKVADALEAS